MGFIPVQPQKTRELRERYRRARRKQQVLFMLAGCGVLLAVGVLGGGWWWAHRAPSLPRPGRADRGQPAPRTPAKALTVAGEKQFAAAPWVFEVDADNLYYFADSRHSLETRPNYPCDTMGAVPARGGKPRWELQGDFPLQHDGLDQGLDWVDGTLVGLTQRLTDKRLDLTGWSSADGRQLWTAGIPQATDAALLGLGPDAIVTYRLPDGYRMVAYSAAKGAKAWGLKLPLRGLHTSGNAAPAPLERHDDAYAVVYTCNNVIGVVDPSTGKLRREFAATGTILDTEVVEQSQTAYILVQGNQQASFSIVAIPLGEGSSRAVLNLLTTDGRVFFAASQHWLLTCCREPQGAADVLRVRCQPLDSSGAQFTHDVEGGHAVCASLVAGPTPEFLLGVSAPEDDKSGALPEAKRFAGVFPERGEVDDAGQTAQPVLSFVSFQTNVLAFADGGVLYRFDGGKQRFVNFRKLRYPQLFARLSDDRSTLLIGSTTEQYFTETMGGELIDSGKAGAQKAAAPLQVLVVK
jgi:hypothetical protein